MKLFYFGDGSSVSYSDSVWRYSDCNCSVEGGDNILRWWIYKYGGSSLLLRMGLMDALSFNFDMCANIVSDDRLTCECLKVFAGMRLVQAWLKLGDAGLHMQLNFRDLLRINCELLRSGGRNEKLRCPSDFNVLADLMI